MKNILIIDDDIHIGNLLEETLKKDGYKISRAYSGTEALLLLSNITPDLILLDLMLPGLNGEEVIKYIKNIPVIVISAKVDIDDKVKLLLSGAVDYITKPFDIRELKARIIVNLKKKNNFVNEENVCYKDLILDLNTNKIKLDDKEIKLTKTEAAILKLLMKNPNQVITKSLILENIANDTPDCTETSLKMHISNLRKKLRSIDENNSEYIESVWGIGFKMMP